MEAELRSVGNQTTRSLIDKQKKYEKEHNLVLTKLANNLWVLLPKERTTPDEIRKIRERRLMDTDSKGKKEKDVDEIANILDAVLQYYNIQRFDFLSHEPLQLESRRMFVDICCERGYDRDVVARLSGYCKNSFSAFRKILNRIPNIYLKKEAIISFL